MQLIKSSIIAIKGFTSHNKIILALFLSALLIRLLYVIFFMQFPLIKDDLQYNLMAKNILDGKGFSYDSVNPTPARGPLYPLFLAATYFLFGYDYNAARIIQAIIGAIACLLVYFIGEKLYNRNTGFYAFAITSFYPSLIGYSGLLYSETLASFLLALTVLFYLFSGEKKSLFLFFITGVSSGLSILCYPKFLFLPVILSVSMYFFNRFRQDFLKYSFGLIIGTLLVLTPWTLRNLHQFGRFIPVVTGTGTTLWHSTLPEDDTEWHFEKEPLLSEFKNYFSDPRNPYEQQEFLFSVKTNEILMQKALKNIKNNPLLFIGLSVKRFFRQWFSSNGNSFYALRGAISGYFMEKDYVAFLLKAALAFLQLYVVVFGCLGMICGLNSNRNNLFSPVFLVIICSMAINSIFMTQPRYQIPVLGLLFMYTVIGTQWALLKLSIIKK